MTGVTRGSSKKGFGAKRSVGQPRFIFSLAFVGIMGLNGF